MLGHDLRNPLSGISGGVELMMRQSMSDERRVVLGKMVLASVTRMAGLIDDVMDFARGRLGGGLTLDRNADEPPADGERAVGGFEPPRPDHG